MKTEAKILTAYIIGAIITFGASVNDPKMPKFNDNPAKGIAYLLWPFYWSYRLQRP